jgi:hypothetical protein
MGCQFTIKKRRKGRRKSQGVNYFDGLGKINPSKFSILILMDWENHIFKKCFRFVVSIYLESAKQIFLLVQLGHFLL